MKFDKLFSKCNKINDNFIIIIRGPASSGKSTLARELVEKLSRTIIFSVEDTIFFQMMAKRSLINGLDSEFIIENNIVSCSTWAYEVYMTHLKTIENYLKAGINIICEGNLIENLNDILNLIPTHYKILIVGLHIPLETLQERESLRDRDIGFAQHQFSLFQSSSHLNHLNLTINDHFSFIILNFLSNNWNIY